MITKVASELLEKVGASKWKEMYTTLSNAGKKLIHGKGVPKSLNAITAGIEKGTENIAARYGTKIVDDATDALPFGGYYYSPLTNEIHAMNPNKAINRALSPLHNMNSTTEDTLYRHALNKRHEAYEASVYHRLEAARRARFNKERRVEILRENPMAGRFTKKTWVPTPKTMKSSMDKFKRGDFRGGIGELAGGDKMHQVVGQHMSPEVLGREIRDVNLGGYDHVVKPTLLKYRKNSGEHGVLSKAIGRDITKGHVSRKDLRKIRSLERAGTEVHTDFLGGTGKSLVVGN